MPSSAVYIQFRKNIHEVYLYFIMRVPRDLRTIKEEGESLQDILGFCNTRKLSVSIPILAGHIFILVAMSDTSTGEEEEGDTFCIVIFSAPVLS